eukprot:3908139-Amphidinium_carterae.1
MRECWSSQLAPVLSQCDSNTYWEFCAVCASCVRGQEAIKAGGAAFNRFTETLKTDAYMLSTQTPNDVLQASSCHQQQ